MASPGTFRFLGGIGEVLASRNYRIYWTGQALHVQGVWIHRVAALWLVFDLTHSTFWLGVIGFGMSIPSLTIGPVAGAVSDRIGHRRTAISALGGGLAVMTCTAVLTWAGAITPTILFVLVTLQAVCVAFDLPSRQSIIPSLLAREIFPKAMAFNWATFNVAAFTGPLIGGVLLSLGGAHLSFAVGVFTLAWMLVALLRLPGPPQPPPGGLRIGDILVDVVNGGAYLFRHPVIPLIMGLHVTAALLLRPYIELMPGFAVQVFDRGEEGLSILLAASGLGGFIASVALATHTKVKWIVFILVVGEILAAIALIIFTAMQQFWIAAVVIGFVGALASATGIASSTLIHLTVEQAYRARVVSIGLALFVGAPALGSLLLGWVAESTGLRIAFAASGAIVLLSAVVVGPLLIKRRALIVSASASTAHEPAKT